MERIPTESTSRIILKTRLMTFERGVACANLLEVRSITALIPNFNPMLIIMSTPVSINFSWFSSMTSLLKNDSVQSYILLAVHFLNTDISWLSSRLVFESHEVIRRHLAAHRKRLKTTFLECTTQ